MTSENKKHRPPRDHIAAMQAQRSLTDRVLNDPDATSSHFKIVLALGRLVTSWSRTTERLSRSQIAEAAGVSEATVKRTLNRWHELGWIIWEPSTTRGRVSRLTVNSEAEPRVTHDDPTTKPEPRVTDDGPRVISVPDSPGPRVTLDDPLPESKQSGEKAAAPASLPDDPDEGLADAIVAHALPEAGCTWEAWTKYPQRDRDRLEAAVADALAAGVDPSDLYGWLSRPATVPVIHWPGFLLSRIRADERRSA